MNGVQSIKYYEECTCQQNRSPIVDHADHCTDFNYPHGSAQGLLNAIQPVGGLVSESSLHTASSCPSPAKQSSLAGLILAPYMADYGGRKWTIFIGCFIVVVAGVVQCLAINIRMFTAARFLIGLGSGFSGLGSPLLITEIAHPVERGKLTALYK